MRSRSLVSTSNRALPSCSDVKGEGDTHVERCIRLHVCKLQGCCHNMLCFEVWTALTYSFKCMWQFLRFPVSLPSPAAAPAEKGDATPRIDKKGNLKKKSATKWQLPGGRDGSPSDRQKREFTKKSATKWQLPGGRDGSNA